MFAEDNTEHGHRTFGVSENKANPNIFGGKKNLNLNLVLVFLCASDQ